MNRRPQLVVCRARRTSVFSSFDNDDCSGFASRCLEANITSLLPLDFCLLCSLNSPGVLRPVLDASQYPLLNAEIHCLAQTIECFVFPCVSVSRLHKEPPVRSSPGVPGGSVSPASARVSEATSESAMSGHDSEPPRRPREIPGNVPNVPLIWMIRKAQ